MLLILLVGIGAGAAFSTTMRADVRIVSVENGGLLFTDNSAGVSGTDCGYSLPLGRETLWLFGDVFLLDATSPAKRYVGGVSNCGLIIPTGSGAASLRKYRFLTEPGKRIARQLIPLEAGEGNETRLWPFGGWYDASAGKAYLYYGVVKTTRTGDPFGFKMIGTGLAEAEPTRLHVEGFRRLRSGTASAVWWKSDEGPVFGASAFSDPSDPEHIYVIGFSERSGRKFGKLARVPVSRLTDLAAYQYFSGSSNAPSWSRSIEQAADIEGLADFPSELSIAHSKYAGGYLAVHSVGIGEKIRLSVAPKPWGPFRPVGEIGAPHRAFAKAFCYAGKEHHELREGGGRVIYVTYVDSERYWLQLLKVTFAKGIKE